ncbi:hypothetical protein KI387_040565, partial [Taxus chinensis]
SPGQRDIWDVKARIGRKAYRRPKQQRDKWDKSARRTRTGRFGRNKKLQHKENWDKSGTNGRGRRGNPP